MRPAALRLLAGIRGDGPAPDPCCPSPLPEPTSALFCSIPSGRSGEGTRAEMESDREILVRFAHTQDILLSMVADPSLTATHEPSLAGRRGADLEMQHWGLPAPSFPARSGGKLLHPMGVWLLQRGLPSTRRGHRQGGLQ
jgi:hypothetical protein